MKQKISSLGAKALTREEQKNIFGGWAWVVDCNNGNSYCLNPEGSYTPAQIVAVCNNDGGYKRQRRDYSIEP